MNHHQRKPPLPITHHPAWRSAIQQLEEAIVRAPKPHSALSDTQKIDLVRVAVFGTIAGETNGHA